MNKKEYIRDVEVSGRGEDKDKQKEENHYEKVCYICRRPESRADPATSVPDGMSLCHDCIQKVLDSVTREDMGFSKLLSMPYMSINLSDLNMTPPAVKIPKKQKVKKKVKEQLVLTMKDIPAPHVIKARLDEYVTGQEKAKKVMTVAIHNHYKRVLLDQPSQDGVGEDAGTDKNIVIEKSNILVIGPTGSKKTYPVKTLAGLLDVPLAIADATSLTETGYTDGDIGSAVSKPLAATDNDVERVQREVISIDEIDEIAKKKQTNARDVSGESVQRELFKLPEGSTAGVPVGSNQKNAMTLIVTTNTGNILLICGGAFLDLEGIIKGRLTKRITMSFDSILKDICDKDPDILRQVINEDLWTFGMTPEFLGRFPVTVTPQGLTEDMMIRTLKEPENAIIKQYERLLGMDEVRLVSKDEALKRIAGEAIKRGTGARALGAILEELTLDIMYEVPRDPNISSVAATRPCLGESGEPLIQMRGQFIPLHGSFTLLNRGSSPGTSEDFI